MRPGDAGNEGQGRGETQEPAGQKLRNHLSLIRHVKYEKAAEQSLLVGREL